MQKYRVIKETFTENGAGAITSILKGKNGKLYIGFTSMDHTVIEYDTATGTYKDIGLMFNMPQNHIPLQDKVHNSLVMDENEIMYIGQGLNINWDAAPYEFNLSRFGGGHLFAFDTNSGKIIDLGVMVPFNAIHGMTYCREKRCIYGYTIPDNHFFKYSIDKGKVTDYGKVSEYACHNYISDQNGNAYGAWQKRYHFDENDMGPKSMKGSYLLKYDYAKDEIIRTRNMIVYGLEHDINGNVGIDSWIRTSRGEIFGSTAIGGAIFKVNSDDSIQFVGKPVLGPRLTSMTEGSDGLIYGCAGFPHMSLFTLNPDTYETKDYGILSNEGAFWYLHCITMGDDGILYGGETDAGNACLVKIIPE